MVILFVFVILWTPYLVTALLGAQSAHTASPAPAQLALEQSPVGVEPDTGNQATPAWTALDDLQLTRLLTNSAHEPPPDRTPA